MQRRAYDIAEAAYDREFIQTVTISLGNAVKRLCASILSETNDAPRTFQEISRSTKGDCVDIIVSEYERFRELLRAVQEEPDDMIIIIMLM